MKITKQAGKELLVEVAIFFCAMGGISLLYMNNLLLLFLVIVVGSVVVYLWHGKDDIYFFIAGFVFGGGGEIINVYFGSWQYTNPTFLGIPIWLPLAWGLVMITVKRIAETFAKISRAG